MVTKSFESRSIEKQRINVSDLTFEEQGLVVVTTRPRTSAGQTDVGSGVTPLTPTVTV